MNVIGSPGEHAQQTDRLAVVQWLRTFLAAAAFVLGFIDGDPREVVPLVVAYLVLTGGAELVLRRAPGLTHSTMSWMLLLDGLFLALALVLTGGAESWVRPLVFFDVSAVTLIVSYRTGLKLAVWYALLVFLGHAASSAGLVGDHTTGSYGDAALTSIGLLLFAIGAAVCSSVNERALRRRSAELHAFVELGFELEQVRSGDDVALVLANHTQDRLDFPRAVVLVRDGEQWKGATATPGGTSRIASPAGTGPLPEYVLRAEAPTLVRALDDAMFDQLLPFGRNVAIVPLIADGETLGVLLAEWGRGPRAQIPAVTVETLAQSVSQTAAALHNAALLSEIEHLATRDGLTGLANRRLFEESLQREVARSHRRKAPLALVVLDVDHFKDVNDTVGHQAGDAVLREVARAMVANTKASDLPARYGGDEFVVLLPDCTGDDALAVAERLRDAVASDVTAVPVTVSAGVGALPGNAGDGERLVAAADAALYSAKREGRDRSVGSNRVAGAGRGARPPCAGAGRRRAGALFEGWLTEGCALGHQTGEAPRTGAVTPRGSRSVKGFQQAAARRSRPGPDPTS